jgi:Spy/CpxP family protein refolding chaperone
MMVRTLRVAGLLLCIATVAVAQQRGRMGGMGGGMALDDQGFQPTAERLAAMLDLSPEQVALITPFRDSLLTETKTLRGQAKQAHDALRHGCRAGVGADSVTALRSTAQASMHALMPARLRFHERIKSVLTPDQAAKLDAHHAEQMKQMQSRMQSGMGGGCGMMGRRSSGQESGA